MRAPVAALMAGLVLSGCTMAPDKSGGQGAPLTVRMATPDPVGSAMAPAYAHFATAVEQASDGRLRVKVTQGASQGHARFDQAVAEMVQQGEYDLALVPARAWDTLDVSSLRPLQTPFLVDNTYTIAYDNSYIGYVCGFNTNGDVLVHLTATGSPGTKPNRARKSSTEDGATVRGATPAGTR